MWDELKIIHYPDPRLKRISASVTAFDDALAQLANRMLELMREARGVGLAAPQVGQNIRMFVMNPTGQPGEDRIFVNPALLDASGDEEAEEGCLSLPQVNTNVVRSRTITLRAQDLKGDRIEETQTGYIARVWQHEIDHLNGVLIIDRVGPGTRMMLKPQLRELEEKWAAEHPAPRQPARARARR